MDTRIIVVPLANPDGFYARDDKLNSNGVHLNRNFATDDWIEYEDERDPETFAGTARFSEAEALVLAWAERVSA